MHKIPALLCLLALTLGAKPALACKVPWFSTASGITSTGYMSAQSGKPCTIRFVSRGPTESTQIVQRPANGTLRIGSIGRVIYTSRPGFVGSDAFTYVRSGQHPQGGPSVRTVRISVTVTP